MIRWVVLGWLVVAGGGCSKSTAPTDPPAPSIASVAPARPAAAVGSAEAPATARASVAFFADKALAMCTDFEGPPEKIARLKEKADGGTGSVLGQSCSSLGSTALTTCTQPGAVVHYYLADHSEKKMADCVKDGGVWSRNDSAEAELSRSKQELEKLEGKLK